MSQDEDVEALRKHLAEKGLTFQESFGKMKVGMRVTHRQAQGWGTVRHIGVGTHPTKGSAIMAWENGSVTLDIFDI